MSQPKSDVLIIGTGASALTSAILLLKHGYTVTLLEAHYKPGGYMHSFEKMGHTYDSGAHYVGALAEKEPFWALLNYLDVYDESVFLPLNEEAFDHFYFQNQKVSHIQFGKGYKRVIDHFCSLFPEDKKGITTFFNELKTVARNFPTYEFLVDYDQTFLLKSLETSLKDVCEKYFKNPELINAMYTYCGLHGVMPGDVSFGLHSVIVDSLIRSGGYGFKKAGDGLVDNFVKTIEKLGGQIHLNEKATRFEIANSKIESVVTRKGKVFKADRFIFSGHPKDMLEIAGHEHFRKLFVNRILNTPESIGASGLYGVAKRDTFKSLDCNHYYLDSKIPEHMPSPENIENDLKLSFITFPERETPESADEVAFSLHGPQPYEWVQSWHQKLNYSRDKDYLALKEKMTEDIFKNLKSFGLKLQEKTLKYETSTTLTNKRFNISPSGSTYGIYHSIKHTGARAHSGRTKIENLFMTGQNTLFPGIMAAAVSGMRTTGFIIGIKEQMSGVRKLMDA